MPTPSDVPAARQSRRTLLISLAVSIAAYSLLWSPAFAVGFVGLLLVHEYGHLLQMRREGVDASAPVFVPFLGAVIAMRSMPDNAGAEARIGLAGPVVGTAATLVVAAGWLLSDSPLLEGLAWVGFALNLFNLLPVLPLDGGRVMAAVSPKLWAVGFVALAALAVMTMSLLMWLVVAFGALEAFGRLRRWRNPDSRAYHTVPARSRAALLTVYVLLAVVCAAGMHFSDAPGAPGSAAPAETAA